MILTIGGEGAQTHISGSECRPSSQPFTYFDEAGTVPMLLGSNIEEGHIRWELARRISEKSNRSLSASRLAAGDLVMVRVGYPGVTAVVAPEIDGCNCASMMIVRRHSSLTRGGSARS